MGLERPPAACKGGLIILKPKKKVQWLNKSAACQGGTMQNRRSH